MVILFVEIDPAIFPGIQSNLSLIVAYNIKYFRMRHLLPVDNQVDIYLFQGLQSTVSR